MQSVLDLRRLEFRKEGLNIDTFDDRDLHVWNDDWELIARSQTAEYALNMAFALQGIVMRDPRCSADNLGWRKQEPTIYRFLRGVEGEGARQANYLISWEPYWIHAAVFSRPPRDLFYVRDVDQFLLSFRLSDEPRLDAEVSPAWKEYQERRRPGMSRAKFDLSNDAPVKLGDHKSFATEIPMFTPDEYERGGRQIAPNLIEFYPPTNAISLRVDVWLEEARTQERVGSLVFRGSLDLTGPRVDIWTFEEPYPMVVPSGEYDAEIRLVNEGTHDDDLRDRERFDRDDLERCEIYLTPRSV